MSASEAAKRYAKALLFLAEKNGEVEAALNDLRAISDAISASPETKEFFSPMGGNSGDQKKVLEHLFSKKQVLPEVKNLVLLLFSKRRAGLLADVVSSYQTAVDEKNGVVRGVVKSAGTLFPEEREQVAKLISKYTGKKALLEYTEDKEILGGLVAQVGSYTFDDSLEAQLRRLPLELKSQSDLVRRSN